VARSLENTTQHLPIIERRPVGRRKREEKRRKEVLGVF